MLETVEISHCCSILIRSRLVRRCVSNNEAAISFDFCDDIRAHDLGMIPTNGALLASDSPAASELTALAHLSIPVVQVLTASWCHSAQLAYRGSRALLGFYERAGRRQSTSWHASGRQARRRGRRQRAATRQLDRVHVPRTVTAWCV